MRRTGVRRARGLGLGLALIAGGLAGGSVSAHRGFGPCEDHRPGRPGIVRVHLRCEAMPDVTGDQRFDLIIGPRDAQARGVQAWGGDSSLRWADRELDRHGCGRHVWWNGEIVVGVDCDH